MSFNPSKTQLLQQRIDASQGRIPCDVLFKNALYLDVFSCQWRQGDLAIFQGVIVGVGDALPALRIEDLKGRAVVPGFIDAHVHLESSMMLPASFEQAVLPRGTTTAICDPHELANVMGTSGIEFFLEASQKMSLDLWVMMSSCVPATHMETNGGGSIEVDALMRLGQHPRALGLAEMMNVPGVLHADPAILAKLEAFSDRPIDGHCPLVRGQALSTCAVGGVSTCHESSQKEEAAEKISKGISVWIREGSVTKDLHELASLLTLATSTTIGFCTDDRNPLDILTEGHLDFLVRSAIRLGVPAEVVYRAASWSVARHYGLDRGPKRMGAVAPGYGADLIVLDDVKTCAIHSVWKRGQRIDAREPGLSVLAPSFENTIRAALPEAFELEGPVGRVHVIGVLEGKIITEHQILESTAQGVMHLSVLERYGRGSKPANGYVTGFGQLTGAIASSVGHDSHNLIVVGSQTSDMRCALAALAEMGGGFCVVQGGKVLQKLPLPFGGLMTAASALEIKDALVALKDASTSIGCVLHEPFLSLAFLSLPVIPKMKLTDRGLVDVEQFKIIDVRV